MGTGGVKDEGQEHAKKSVNEVMAKQWPEDIHKRFDVEQDPFMIVIDRDFAAFNPSEHRWPVIWFSDFFKEQGQIYRLFGLLAKRVEQGKDIFEYVRSLVSKQKAKRLGKYFEIKPKIFGVSIDMKAMLEDLVAPN